MMRYYLQALANYALFTGRARRKEFFYFGIFNNLIALFILLLEVGLVTAMTGKEFDKIPIFYNIYLLITMFPSIGVTTRRLHDTNHSGWWQVGLHTVYLIPFVSSGLHFPLLGLFFLPIYFFFLDSQPGDNQYGRNPKGIHAPVTIKTEASSQTD